MSDRFRHVWVAASYLVVCQRALEGAEAVRAIRMGLSEQSRANLRRTGGAPCRSVRGKNWSPGSGIFSRYSGAWQSSLLVVFDDKAKPLRERRWSSPDSSETPPPALRVFSFRLNCPNASLLAPRVRGAGSHSRDTLHLHSACAWSKSPRKCLSSKEKAAAAGRKKSDQGSWVS